MDSKEMTTRCNLQRKNYPGLTDIEYNNYYNASVFLTEVILNLPLNHEESLELRNLIARCDMEKTPIPFVLKSTIYLKAFTRLTGKQYYDLLIGNFDYNAFSIQFPQYTFHEVTIPTPPLVRIIKETGGAGTCQTCGSTLIRKYWLFGKLGCVQPKCSNYIKIKE